MEALLDKFKRKIEEDYVIGPFMKTGDPAFVEVAGYAGFDFAILDTEHGPVSIESMQNNVRAALVAGIVPIIRVEDHQEVNIGKALDIGALGVQVPQITNAKEAEDVVRAARFYPNGNRGVCRFVRAAKYSAMDRYEYFRSADDNLIILQLEGQEALRNIDEILDVSGVDVIFIGPYDLSQSLGVPGEVNNPKVIGQMEYIVNKAREKNKVIGTFIDRLEDIGRWKKAGVRYLSYSVDVGIFLDGCRAIVEAAKKV